jgi:hypothetical protein
MGLVLDNITWRPRIGDPNPLAWVITAGYFIACILCYFADRRFRSRSNHDFSGRAWFWFTLMLMMFALGWNKQLDLQTLLTQIGREISRQGGWYARRQPIQAAFVLCCAVAGFGFLALGLRLMRGSWRRFGLAYLGIVYLVTFVVIRAASLHHIDYLLYGLPVVGNRVNTSLELGGIILVCAGATLALLEASTTVGNPQSDSSTQGLDMRVASHGAQEPTLE